MRRITSANFSSGTGEDCFVGERGKSHTSHSYFYLNYFLLVSSWTSKKNLNPLSETSVVGRIMEKIHFSVNMLKICIAWF